MGAVSKIRVTYVAPDFDEPMSEEELKDWEYGNSLIHPSR
jgi:hypothetical protein